MSMESDSVATAPMSSWFGQDKMAKCMDALPFEEASWNSTSAQDRIKYFQPPNPGWRYGDSIEKTEPGKKWMEAATSDNWVHIDPVKTGPFEMYRYMTTGLQPRPISCISSVSAEGKENLACFSSINGLAPPGVVSFLCIADPSREDAISKDTPANIQATKDFTVNMVNLPWIAQAIAASVDAPEHISEWDITGLTREPSTYVKAPRIKESVFSLECVYIGKFEMNDLDTEGLSVTALFGRVKCIHMRKDILNARGYPDPAKMLNVTRMGDITCGTTTEVFRLPNHDWKKDGVAIEKALEQKKKQDDTEEVNFDNF